MMVVYEHFGFYEVPDALFLCLTLHFQSQETVPIIVYVRVLSWDHLEILLDLRKVDSFVLLKGFCMKGFSSWVYYHQIANLVMVDVSFHNILE
jgi:hypothetical protein